MTKIRTLSQLNDVMTTEFAWRKRELTNLKILVVHNGRSHLRDLCVRSAIAVLYAHWEGFIKRIGGAYLEFVARQQLAHSELANCFLALAVRSLLQGASSSKKIAQHMAIVSFFRSEQAAASKLPTHGGIGTLGNLNSEVLRDIVLLLGLDYTPYETKEKLIDETLLKNRNGIAHGDFLLVKPEDYVALHDDIFSLMQVFYNQVDNAATTKAYRV